MCGVLIEPNQANMCANCIRSRVRTATLSLATSRPCLPPVLTQQRDDARRPPPYSPTIPMPTPLRMQVDISEGIPKNLSVHFCVKCERCVVSCIYAHCPSYSRGTPKYSAVNGALGAARLARTTQSRG
jgi:hypothetical protein